MKTTTHFFFALAFMILSVFAKAQDTLYLKSGLKVPSQITEITPSVIRYKKASNPDGPTYVIDAADIHFIKYRNGTTDTITATAPVVVTTPDDGLKAPVSVQIAPVPAKPLDLHPPIYNAGMFYKYDGRRIKTHEMQDVVKSVNDPEIDLHVKKARLDKGLEYIGFVGIPVLVVGIAATGIALFNNDGLGPNEQRTSYAPGAVCFVVAAAALATSITFKIVGKNHNRAAVDLYNEKY